MSKNANKDEFWQALEYGRAQIHALDAAGKLIPPFGEKSS